VVQVVHVDRLDHIVQRLCDGVQRVGAQLVRTVLDGRVLHSPTPLVDRANTLDHNVDPLPGARAPRREQGALKHVVPLDAHAQLPSAKRYVEQPDPCRAAVDEGLHAAIVQSK